MKNFIVILFILVSFNSCELITIGKEKPKPIVIDQKSAIGAVYLFKVELDSSNIPAATQILANPKGGTFLAFERYELYDEVARLGRLIGKKPITYVKTDTLSLSSCRINIEFDYLKAISFTTSIIDSNWYIVGYME